MDHPKRLLTSFIRILIIAGLLFQQIAIPLDALAASGRVSSPTETSLLRGQTEEVNAYLERVAIAQPDLFQQAAMAAVQDAFNGNLPEVAGDQAMEEQIAYYLNSAVAQSEGTPPPPLGTNGSSIEGDTYRWNSSQTDPNGLGGSAWQMTARPGGDPELFAKYFEEMVANEPLPSSLPFPEDLQAQAAEPAFNQIAWAGPSVNSSVPEVEKATAKSAEKTTEKIIEKPVEKRHKVIAHTGKQERVDLWAAEASLPSILAPDRSTQTASELLAAGTTSLADQSSASDKVESPLVVMAEVLQADLAVTMTAPISAAFGSVITYTVTVVNHGPSPASAVQLTQTLPANGIYTGTVAGCTGGSDSVACTVGALAVNESRNLNLAVQMKGNGVVTATVTAKDSGGTVDPGGQAATASAAVTVTSNSRLTMTVGKVVIAANKFVTVTNQVEASGAVEIGAEQPDKSIAFHLKLGPDDAVSWLAGQEAVSGEGTLSQVLKDFKLFVGPFKLDASQKNPTIVPEAASKSAINELGGFSVIGDTAITEVAVISGTAAVSATIAFELPGFPVTQTVSITSTAGITATPGITDTQVITVNQKSITALVKPGGKVDGTLDKFSMVFSGLNIEVAKATMTDDEIKVKQANLTLPDTFGGLTGIISDISIKANSISFGGAGVKIPFPDIYPVGKPTTATVTTTVTTTLAVASLTPTAVLTDSTPVTQTVTVTPTVAIVKNSATVAYSDGKYSLQLEGTLQLWLPNNQRNIPIEFKIDDTGKLQAKVKEINLRLAGQDLVMKEVELSNTGLKVEEATLTFQSHVDKSKEKAAKARLMRTEPNADPKPEEKTPDKKLSIIVKQVVIDKSGISVGGAGITNYLPDIKIGKIATFGKLEFTVVVNNPTGDASLELELKGVFKVNSEGNEQETKISAKMDKDGKFSGKIDKLTLTIAKSTLEMSELEFDGKGVRTQSVSLTLPEILGKTKVTVNQFKIDENGFSFGDANVAIPVNFTIGKPEATNSLAVKGSLTLVLAQDRTYGLAVEGTVTIKVASQTVEAAGSVRWDTSGAVRGSVDSFKLVIAGMELAIKSATVENSTLKANEATLSIPKAWGGLSATVYQIEVGESGFSMGGGSFKLPEIAVGDMKLSLEGTLKKEGDGYVIGAGGSLKMPNVGGAGCSGLGVAVEIFTGSNQEMVMRIQPLSAEQADAFQLRKISVSLQCTIPLGASGFDLTSVSGTFTLSDNVTKIEIKVTMESKLRVGSFNALTADGDMTIESVKDPKKFEIGIGASMKLFSMFEAARAKALMRFTDGDVPFLFKAELNINAVIAKGEIKLSAWTKNGDFHMTGRIYGEVGVRRGALANNCWTIRVPYIERWSWGFPIFGLRETQLCAVIPPSDWFISATMEFGEFQKSGSTAWGFKAGVSFFGKNYGIYVDSDGKFSVGNVDQYKLVDAPTLRRARLIHEKVAAGLLARSGLSAEELDLLESYHFVDDQIFIDVVTITKPGDLGVTVLRSSEDADVVVTLVRPDGLYITGVNPPDNVTFREEYLAAENVTDPTTREQIPAGELVPTIQTIMNVTNVGMGKWQVMLNREPTYDFIINVDGTVYGPPVEKLAIGGQDTLDNQVDLTWTQTAEITSTVSIYATTDTITTTASYTGTQIITDTNGIQATQVLTTDLGVVTQFGGMYVQSFTYLPGKQTLTEAVDLSFLRSGTYSLWLEVDDGQNPPTRRYFPGTATVWHDWQENWQANMAVTPQLGGLTVAWGEHPNPDVDGYTIELTSSGNNSDPDTYSLEVGQAFSQTITGLSARQTYSVTVVAYDTGTERTSVSESVSAQPLAAPFTFAANPGGVTVNGGSGASVTLQIASAVNPYPGSVFLDLVDLPDGMDLALTTDILTPTVAGVQAGLIITPADTLPGGVYTVTVEAAANGDVKQVQIPVTVQEPAFTLQASSNGLTIFDGGSASVDISAAYQFGETDVIDIDLSSLPPGLDWDFDNPSFAPGGKATLTLTDTGYLAFGTYEVTIYGTDYEHERTLALPLTVAGFEIFSDWDSWAALNEEEVAYEVMLEGAAWPDAVTFAFDPASLGDRFIAELSSNTANVPATVTAYVTALADTPPGVYELLLHATSGNVAKTLPLYLTVEEDENATDLQMSYSATPEDNVVIAGESYSYTLAPRNISAVAAVDVSVAETTFGGDYLSLVDGAGCGVDDLGDQMDLTCDLSDIPAASHGEETVITWQVDADAPDGELLTHQSDVLADDTTNTETSTLDNLAELTLTVARLADLTLQAQASPALAGESMTYTATVSNDGPSYAGDVVVEFYLPEGVSLESTSADCVQDAELVICQAGELAPSESAVATITVAIEPDQREGLETLIFASSASDDPNYDNNYDFLFSDVDAFAELVVSIRPDRTSATEGDTVNYTVVVTNTGPSQATDVDVALIIPDTLDIVEFRVGDVESSADELVIAAHKSLTLTVSALFLQDSGGAPVLIDVEADAVEADFAQSSDQSLTVANANPTAVLSGTLAVNEGEWGILTVAVDDPGVNDPLTVAWDLDNDGQFDDGSEAIVLFDARTIDGPATRPIAVRVQDGDGGQAIANGTVTIQNVAPVVDVGPDQFQQFDGAFVLDYEFVDSSPSDSPTTWVDWGDGTVENLPLAARSGTAQVSHTYNQIGKYTVNLCVNDNSGGEGCDQLIAQAACRENGLAAQISSAGDDILIDLKNASGTVTIPAGLPLTLYNGTSVLQTFSLAQEMPVGASQSLRYTWPNGAPNGSYTAKLAIDDNGQGGKTTPLCSGTAEKTVAARLLIYLPIVHQNSLSASE